VVSGRTGIKVITSFVMLHNPGMSWNTWADVFKCP